MSQKWTINSRQWNEERHSVATRHVLWAINTPRCICVCVSPLEKLTALLIPPMGFERKGNKGKGEEENKWRGKHPWNKFMVTTLAPLEKVGVICQVPVFSVISTDAEHRTARPATSRINYYFILHHFCVQYNQFCAVQDEKLCSLKITKLKTAVWNYRESLN